jgi:hypothetical protein
MEEKWTAEQTTCLARELMFRCLSQQDTFSSGNLYSGGLGASYLLYYYSQHVRRHNSNNASPSIYCSKRPLQQACDGAEHAVRHPSYQRSKKRQASMFESEWVVPIVCMRSRCFAWEKLATIQRNRIQSIATNLEQHMHHNLNLLSWQW